VFRYNGGVGGVTCDGCNLLYDSHLSYNDYLEDYGLGNFCWRCVEKIQKGEELKNKMLPEEAKEKMKNIKEEYEQNKNTGVG